MEMVLMYKQNQAGDHIERPTRGTRLHRILWAKRGYSGGGKVRYVLVRLKQRSMVRSSAEGGSVSGYLIIHPLSCNR
jgi:hypothetical protein